MLRWGFYIYETIIRHNDHIDIRILYRRQIMTAQELINIAQNEVGVKENPANSNNVKYNTWYYG